MRKNISRLAAGLICAVGLFAGPTQAATRGMDCPLAFQPYSSNTILYDLLINPSAKAVLDRVTPELEQKMQKLFEQRTTPTFLVLLTPRMIAKNVGIGEEALKKLDDELAIVPLTQESALARCARYDETPPELPAKLKQPALLVFDKITGFRDGPSVDAATAALRAIAKRRGWELVFTDNAAVFNPRDLQKFKAVIWNNVSGDALTLTQRRAMRAYIEDGGGFAAFHGSGGDPYVIWDWYVDTLIGAHFMGHPGKPQFQTAKVAIDDPQDPIVRGMKDWSMKDEWYSFKNNPRDSGAQVLATLDESTYDTNGLAMGKDHPIAWKKCVAKGKSFYSAIGHMPEAYDDPNAVKLLERGIAWVAGMEKGGCGK